MVKTAFATDFAIVQVSEGRHVGGHNLVMTP